MGKSVRFGGYELGGKMGLTRLAVRPRIAVGGMAAIVAIGVVGEAAVPVGSLAAQSCSVSPHATVGITAAEPVRRSGEGHWSTLVSLGSGPGVGVGAGCVTGVFRGRADVSAVSLERLLVMQLAAGAGVGVGGNGHGSDVRADLLFRIGYARTARIGGWPAVQHGTDIGNRGPTVGVTGRSVLAVWRGRSIFVDASVYRVFLRRIIDLNRPPPRPDGWTGITMLLVSAGLELPLE